MLLQWKRCNSTKSAITFELLAKKSPNLAKKLTISYIQIINGCHYPNLKIQVKANEATSKPFFSKHQISR